MALTQTEVRLAVAFLDALARATADHGLERDVILEDTDEHWAIARGVFARALLSVPARTDGPPPPISQFLFQRYLRARLLEIGPAPAALVATATTPREGPMPLERLRRVVRLQDCLGKQITLPRLGHFATLDAGDWDVPRRCLARIVRLDGPLDAILFHWPGHKSWAGRGESRYTKGELVLITRRGPGESFNNRTTFAEGERLCKATLRKHAAVIDKVFGDGAALVLDPKQTLTIKREV